MVRARFPLLIVLILLGLVASLSGALAYGSLLSRATPAAVYVVWALLMVAQGRVTRRLRLVAVAVVPMLVAAVWAASGVPRGVPYVMFALAATAISAAVAWRIGLFSESSTGVQR